MKQSEPLISVILPVCNAGKFLRESLKSLLSQTHRKIEVIAIDDHSKDKSYDTLKRFKKKDKRLKVFRNKKRYGLTITLNRAIKCAQGQYIAFAGTNGASALKRLQDQLEYLLNHPKVAAVGTQCVFLNEKNKRTGKSLFPEDHEVIKQTLLPCSSILPETVMVNRTILPKDIMYFSKHQYPFIYSDVFMKFLSYAEVANMPKALYYHRKIESISTKAEQIKSMYNMSKLWLKSFVRYEERSSIRSIFLPLLKQT